MISSFGIRIGKTTANTLRYYKVIKIKESETLKKMLDKIAVKRKNQYHQPKLLEKGTLPAAYRNEGVSRRIATLNKVYMENLIIMLSSGSNGSKLTDLGIEITKVNFSSDLNYLDIYWITRKDDIPENDINATLSGAVPELQEKMGAIRYTEKIPFLRFVKDKRLQRELSLEKIFQSIDFGKDFEPVHRKKVNTEDHVEHTKEVPEMRQNVLGLDHAKITERIKAAILKYKTIDTKKPEVEPEAEPEEAQVPLKLIEFNKKEFYKFYNRNRILAIKMRRKQAKKEQYYTQENGNEEDIDEDDDDDDDDDDEDKVYAQDFFEGRGDERVER